MDVILKILKKTAYAWLISPFVYAGTMDFTATNNSYSFSPFVGLEGTYSWYSSNKTLIINNEPVTYNHNGWGGRVSGGMELSLQQSLNFTSEIGWGYFAKSSANNYVGAPYSSNAQFYGFDILAGIGHQFHRMNFFVKGGAMILNRDVSGILDFTLVNNVGTLTGAMAVDSLSTFVMPEVKVGLQYPIIEKLSLSFSYMHIFGSNTNYRMTINNTANQLNLVTALNKRPPSFNTLMLGLQYAFF